MLINFLKITLLLIIGILYTNYLYSQETVTPEDSATKAKQLLQEAMVKYKESNVEITIRNVDISRFPIVKIIVEAYNKTGEPLDTLYTRSLKVVENNVEREIISVEKISVNERVPVDFVFIFDITGTMQKYIDPIKNYISSFATNLIRRGIDYRLGLILFSDYVEKTYQLTDNVVTFLTWLNPVRASGGGDEKENALEALRELRNIQFRPAANRVGILITDAPYHQLGEKGDGTTYYTTSSIIKEMVNNDYRIFTITPPKLKEYKLISEKTRGRNYDIDYPFTTILDNFSMQLTNLYAIKYKTTKPAIPDSINIALLNEKRKELVRKTIPIIELGRKLIIENLLYETNSAELSDSVPELEVLTEFMKNKPSVVILVEGHTDNRGSHAINDRLSLERAESVKRYLLKKGIKANRIQTTGYGKRRPIADNDSEFGRRLNRRTEIVIVAK